MVAWVYRSSLMICSRANHFSEILLCLFNAVHRAVFVRWLNYLATFMMAVVVVYNSKYDYSIYNILYN